ncbi:MAG: hypothetical protein MJA27_19500 [Pseudanabaenales cyanobacterium]|nr:hypothetical protein [Pseudanabaenales cyanobacterium]
MDKRLVGNVIYGPWDSLQDQSISTTQEFYGELEKHLGILKVKEKSLLEVCQLFNISRSVYPNECNDTQIRLQDLHVFVHDLCLLFGNADLLPNKIAQHRYALLSPLCYIDDRIPWLNKQIKLFSFVCLDLSKETIEWQHIIGDHLTGVTQSIKTFELKIAGLVCKDYTLHPISCLH